MVTSSTRDSISASWDGHVHVLMFTLWSILCACVVVSPSSALPTSAPHDTKQQPPNYAVHTSLTCFSQLSGALALTCRDLEPSMVRIQQVAYHHSKDGTCLPSPAHCTYVAPELEVYPCVGRAHCEINTPTGGQGPVLRACGDQHATYMTVRYQCIPVSEVVDVCSTPDLTSSQWGFITSPRYPLNYPGEALSCTVHLSSSHPGQRYHVRLIDLRLENQQVGTCSDWLQLFDGHRSETYCNVRTDHQAMTTFNNWIDIKFQTDSSNTTWKGFWLYYEAFPYIDTPHLVTSRPIPQLPDKQHNVPDRTIANPNQPQRPQNEDDAPPMSNSSSSSGNSNSKSPPTFSKQRTREQTAKDSLTVGIIVGVVLGIMLCIAVVLAVVVFIRK